MNDDAEFFDAVPVAPGERGESFGLSSICYARMAKCALRCMEYGRTAPVTIQRLRSGPGCQLVLYGPHHVYTLRVSADTSPAQVAVYFLPLDSTLGGPGCSLYLGYDEPQNWHQIADLIIWREGDAGSGELLEWAEISDQLRESNDWGDWWK